MDGFFYGPPKPIEYCRFATSRSFKSDKCTNWKARQNMNPERHSCGIPITHIRVSPDSKYCTSGNLMYILEEDLILMITLAQFLLEKDLWIGNYTLSEPQLNPSFGLYINQNALDTLQLVWHFDFLTFLSLQWVCIISLWKWNSSCRSEVDEYT